MKINKIKIYYKLKIRLNKYGDDKMGLDMFLNGVKCIESTDKIMEEINKEYGFTISRRIIKDDIMYWRKANAIHAWFVENCQHQNDDCRPHKVSIEDLAKLKNTCEEVIKHPQKASELLPTKEGFFFGETEYDEWYYEEIKITYNKLKVLLEENKYDWYIYQSSW